MAIFRCKMCGGDLEIIENASSCTCDFCGTQQTIPTVKDENLQGLFNRANVLRMKSEFDKAEEIYEKILQSSSTEAEAYWGLILCKYGIEYVEDPATFKRVPTCHRASYESITADVDYKNALQYADVQQKLIYEAEAKEIEEVQKGIMALVANEKPYDVFICYKETDESGKRTQDSVIANDIYYQLTQEGFKVFYAAITLEDKLGTEYEPYIFSALNTAKVMLSLGTKPEYFNAVWVKNEWSRFLKIMKKDRSKMLIPCYRDMDAYELPEEFAHLQAQDMSKIGFINDIVRGIKKVVVKEDANQQAPQQTIIQQAAPVNSNVQALLDRGNMAIEDSEWEKADGFFEEVLNQDAKCAEAYLGKLLAREHKGSWDSYIRNQCYKYSDADYKKLEACPEDTAAINDAASKYVIENYVKESEITTLFEYDRSYSSCLSKREMQKEKQLYELERDKILSRIKQYMSGELAEQINNGITAIKDSLNKRIAKAKDEDDKPIASVIAAYNNHVNSANSKAKEIYDKACEKREADYQSYVAKMQSAEGVSSYISAKKGFGKLGAYKDSVKNVEYCQSEIDRLNAEAMAERERADAERRRQAEAAAARTKKITIISAASIAVIIAICIIVSSVMKANKYKDAQAALAEGRYEDAIAGFEELGDYEDSAELVLESKYQNNIYLLKNNQHVDEIKFANNEWLVLETQDGKALLLSEAVIGNRPYNDEFKDTTWEKCTLRKWLNNGWLNSSFNEAEKNAIVETNVINADNPEDGTAGGNDTVDKIFLLSIDEVNQYFSSDEECIALAAEGESAYWWLRSPGGFSLHAAYVRDDGSVKYGGRSVDDAYGAVRPALWVDVSNL